MELHANCHMLAKKALVVFTGAISSTAKSTDVPLQTCSEDTAQWLQAQDFRRETFAQLQILKHNSCVVFSEVQTSSEFPFPHL